MRGCQALWKPATEREQIAMVFVVVRDNGQDHGPAVKVPCSVFGATVMLAPRRFIPLDAKPLARIAGNGARVAYCTDVA